MSRGIVSANAFALHAKLCLVLAVGLIVTQTVSKYSSAENPIMLTKTFTPIDYHLFCLKRNAARTGPHASRMMFAIARNRWCILFPTDRPS